VIHVEVDGRVPSLDVLADVGSRSYGHFTAMQVRAGRTRGLDLHLARLAAQHRDLFDREPDSGWVRSCLAAAVRRFPDASVKLTLTGDPDGAEHVTVLLRDPVEAPTAAQRLLSVVFERQVPAVKHLGTFVQGYQARSAERQGYDDALFVTADGLMLETTVWNSMQLLQRHGPAAGLPVQSRAVALAEVADAEAVFVSNSWGITPVSQVDDLQVGTDAAVAARVVRVYTDIPLEPLS
jgi:branched-subunit amino acid aminotransferase/4-amino-4-deoxychorismate lyase